MDYRPFDMTLLLECAQRFAAMIGAPQPDETRVWQVIKDVIDERGALENAALGLITRDEAAQLLLAHFHSALFMLTKIDPTAEAWDPSLVDDIKRGLFGTNKV